MSAAKSIRKWILLSHRWTGVVLCLLFIMWFISGIVLMYVPFPEVRSQERLRHMPPLQGDLHLLPSQAADAAGIVEPQDLRLAMVMGRPVYRLSGNGKIRVVFADTGEVFRGFSPEQAQQVAADWLGQPPVLLQLEEKQTKEDQWTVPQRYRPMRPLWKFSNSRGDVVYVSDTAAEVVDHTDRFSRWGSYFGAIPHWIYFTQLRKDAAEWRLVVIWVSGAGCVMTFLGLIAGICLYSPSKRYRFPDGPSSVPFAGYKRWHVLLGYIFGILTFTWILSGLFSMSLIRLKPESVETRIRAAMHAPTDGGARSAFAAHPPQWALTTLSQHSSVNELKINELELVKVAGEPVYVAWQSSGQGAVLSLNGEVSATVPVNQLLRTVQAAAAPYQVVESRILTQYDRYYIDRHGEKPLPIFFVLLNDPAGCTFYINPKDASIVMSYNPASRWNRWLYHGLHSLDLPWLYSSRPVWDIFVIACMTTGAGLSITALILAFRRLRRLVVSRF